MTCEGGSNANRKGAARKTDPSNVLDLDDLLIRLEVFDRIELDRWTGEDFQIWEMVTSRGKHVSQNATRL